MALADDLKREAKKYETVKTAELEWTDRIKLDHLILFLKEDFQKNCPRIFGEKSKTRKMIKRHFWAKVSKIFEIGRHFLIHI